MRKLKSLQEILYDAEDEGIAPETLMIDPNDVVEIDENTIHNLTQCLEETPEDD